MSYVIQVLTCDLFTVALHLPRVRTAMILRHFISQSLPSNLLSLLFLLFSTALVTAEDFDCHVTTGGLKWDLTPLKGTHTVSRTRDSPPTIMVDELRFNLCKNLKLMKGVPEDEQASSIRDNLTMSILM